MDKLSPTFQDTPVSTKVAESVGTWYISESTSGRFSSAQLGWLQAAGWQIYASVTSGGVTTSFLSRRRIKPEAVLTSLVESYTDAYNEGRTLNDQRYDDLLVLYINSLSITEDEYNALQTDDDTFETLIEALITLMGTDYSTWSADVDGDLDTWGTDKLAELDATFVARSSAAEQELMDRGLDTSTLLANQLNGIARDKQRALNGLNREIIEAQLDLKNKIYAAKVDLRGRVLAARDRLRTFLHGAKDRQVAARERAAAALARLVEARTDSYPDLGEIGRLAASLGAGSPESYGA